MRYFSILILCSTSLLAQDFGSIGNTFHIAEEDMLEVLEATLKTPHMQAKIDKLQEQFKMQALKSAERPKPVANIISTIKARTYTFDPSAALPYDLQDAKGNQFYQAHKRVNPLDYFSLPRPLIFLDADDKEQLNFALNYEEQHNITVDLILVKGAPFELMRKLKRVVFFDQGGSITHHFKIKQVPAILTQADKVLIISEYKL